MKKGNDAVKSIVETNNFWEAAVLRYHDHDLHSISKDGDQYIYRLYFRSDTHSIIDDFETCRLDVDACRFSWTIQDLILLRMSAVGDLDMHLNALKKIHDKHYDKKGLDQDF